MITADGSDDDLIQPEGLPDYKVPPVTLGDPASAIPEPNQAPETDGEMTEVNENDDGEHEFDDMTVEDGDDDGNIFELFNI